MRPSAPRACVCVRMCVDWPARDRAHLPANGSRMRSQCGARQAHLRPANRVHGRNRPLDAQQHTASCRETASCVHSFAYVPEFTLPSSGLWEAIIQFAAIRQNGESGIKTIIFANFAHLSAFLRTKIKLSH